MPRDTVSRTANVGTVGKNGLTKRGLWGPAGSPTVQSKSDALVKDIFDLAPNVITIQIWFNLT